MWVLDHLDDLDADFLAIYGIQDMYALPSPRFFRLAWRVAAYDGVMTARISAESTDGSSSVVNTSRKQTISGTRAEIGLSLPGWFEMSEVKKDEAR